ncbi:MAG: hypothetical protein LBU51_07110 [Bacteroidales bacterium]|jgi:hypothetical protein|nr:hypothetical protein [Bacteroidales bacterium]
MNNFEDELDKIRVQLYEETKNMDKASLVKTVNANAKKIADEFGIKIIHNNIKEKLTEKIIY